MSYQVRYKKSWWLWWRKEKGVKADAFFGQHRWLTRDDDSVVLLPTQGFLFEFGPERTLSLLAAAGQVKPAITPYPVLVGRKRLMIQSEASTPTPTGHVVLLLASDRRLEVPPGLRIRLGKERFGIIAKQLQAESGGQVRV